jgi:hypothetical protein
MATTSQAEFIVGSPDAHTVLAYSPITALGWAGITKTFEEVAVQFPGSSVAPAFQAFLPKEQTAAGTSYLTEGTIAYIKFGTAQTKETRLAVIEKTCDALEAANFTVIRHSAPL